MRRTTRTYFLLSSADAFRFLCRPLYQTANSRWRALSSNSPVAPGSAFSYITNGRQIVQEGYDKVRRLFPQPRPRARSSPS